LVAGHAVGLFTDLAATANTSTAIRDHFQPNWQAHIMYGRMIEQYQAVLDLLATPMHVLAGMHTGAEVSA
jgi:hypothetical protein